MSSLKKSMTGSKEDGTSELRRGPWTLEEDTLLVHYIGRHGEGRWNLLAKRAGIVLNPLYSHISNIYIYIYIYIYNTEFIFIIYFFYD